jgi:hypothetical protein
MDKNTLPDEIAPAPALFGPEVLDEVAPTERAVIQVTIGHDGRLTVRGPRVAIVELLVCCARYGMVVELESLNWCG